MSADMVPGSQLTRDQAEILTDEINRELGNMASSHERARDLIGQAIRLDAPTALGYSGLSEYVSARFAGALARLGVETRREVVKELTAGGMSTRAIAPVVGVSQGTVVNDLRSGEQDYSPESAPANVVGLDGKSYTRPEPQPERRPVPPPVLADPRVIATQLLDRICLLAEAPNSQHREHAAAWARQINTSDATLPRLDAAIQYLTLLREELAR